MSADVESRKLHSLRVTDLRNELGKRNLDSKGVKNELVERLAKALESEGHNPEEYVFDTDSADKKTPRSSKRRTLGEGDFDKEDVSANDLSSTAEDEPKDTKDVSENREAVATGNDDVEQEADGRETNQSIGASTDNIVEAVKTEPEKTSGGNPTAKAAEKEVKEEPLEEPLQKNDAPKEQRVNTSKKSVTEESKEKPDDTEDSITLTIGEDEVKSFGEEEESTHEKDGKENRSETSNTGENAKTNTKNGEGNKQDVKANARKPSSKVNGSSRNLWVSGLSSMTRATDLKTLFSKYGKVVAAKIVTNAKTPGSRCYGYVTMLSADDATVSMQNLHKTELSGRMILVERAKDDGTGPARPKVVKKETDKKKTTDVKDEKKPAEEKKKISIKVDSDAKSDDKKTKEDKKDTNEETNGGSKTGSVKNEKIQSNRSRSHGSSKSKERSNLKPRDQGRPRSGVLTFAQIKEERERHRLRERERALRIEEQRRQIERERQRETERKQREEANRLERERMRLKMEREKIEREKAELLRMEQDAQRQERERLQREKEELRRAQMKLEESRRAVKRPLEITRTFEDDRKRRPPSPDRRHVHVSSSSTSRKEPVSRSNGTRRGPPSEYAPSRRAYDNSIEFSRKEASSHSSRDKTGKESSRYDHHSYQSSRGADDVRSKDVRHRYPDPPNKTNSKVAQSSRYGRSVDSWARSSSGNVSSSVKQFSNVGSSGGNASMSSRDAWGADRKSEAPPPWSRNTSTSDRWANSSASSSSMGLARSGPMSSGNTMYSSGGNYSANLPNMNNMLTITSAPPSYTDRFDAYKSGMRKY